VIDVGTAATVDCEAETPPARDGDRRGLRTTMVPFTVAVTVFAPAAVEAPKCRLLDGHGHRARRERESHQRGDRGLAATPTPGGTR